MIDARDPDDETALHFAVRWRNTQIVRLLLEHGTDPNAHNKKGRTPSQFASAFGYHEMVEVLSGYGTKSVK